MKKNIIYAIVLIVVVVITFALVKLTDTPYDTKIEKLLADNSYTLVTNGLYSKQMSAGSLNNYNNCIKTSDTCKYEVNTFTMGLYELSKNIKEYNNEVASDLDIIYSYHDNTLTYTYRVNYKNSLIIFNGTYNNSKFTCKKEFATGIDSSNSQDVICEKIKTKVLSFENETKVFFPNVNYINYIKKQKID